MGFFSDLKDDLSQAVNELLPEEELPKESDVKEEKVTAPEETSETVNGFDTDLGAMLDKVEEMEVPEEQPIYVAPAAAEAVVETVPVSAKNAANEVAVLTDSMIINGNIATEGALDVRGSIVGNVEALGKLNITGAIQGNSQAAEIYAEGAKITGELRSGGSVKIGQSTVIIGNIYASSAVIAGAVKGDIDVKGPVILDSSAIVMGDIKSKSVQINNGAVIEGMCSQCYAEVNPTSFFEELKKMK
ncbi:MAG: polymer-forming cytoskeletal protein [Lachnospiraceae bacterium]|nr:polymer-forming cytoskeletal protein [Lachnospiraceae bacterium]MDD7627922.1 polymer-forming cytoskeletal protein [Lachnospiraceae bacterium]MDY4119703.1 polymer-forming cytoskeletal protein [Lachnospiraceae bacterium]